MQSNQTLTVPETLPPSSPPPRVSTPVSSHFLNRVTRLTRRRRPDTQSRNSALPSLRPAPPPYTASTQAVSSGLLHQGLGAVPVRPTAAAVGDFLASSVRLIVQIGYRVDGTWEAVAWYNAAVYGRPPPAARLRPSYREWERDGSFYWSC